MVVACCSHVAETVKPKRPCQSWALTKVVLSLFWGCKEGVPSVQVPMTGIALIPHPLACRIVYSIATYFQVHIARQRPARCLSTGMISPWKFKDC